MSIVILLSLLSLTKSSHRVDNYFFPCLHDSLYIFYEVQSCRSHADIEKYKWVDDEKLYGDNTFVHDHKLSRHCIGLSGMKFSDAEIEELASKIHKMKEEGTHLCCSIGFLTKKQALMLKEAGLDRINHNLNTSRSNYPNICMGTTGLCAVSTVLGAVSASGVC